MELYQLRTFAMVADEGNLTRAAKRLHTSQPAVSAQIKALEDELGLALFQRTPRGMVLTADGLNLREHARRVLATVAELEREAGELRGVLHGELRIGINAEPEILHLAELVQEMRSRHPELQIHLRQAMSGEVETKLEAGELDAGFIFGETSSEKLFATELAELELVVAGAPGMQEELRGLPAVELANYPWIATPQDCPYHWAAAAFFARHAIKPVEAALIDDESIIRLMVKKGVGLSLLLRHDALGKSPSERLAIWDREPMHLPLFIACLDRRKDEPMLRALIVLLLEIHASARPPS